TVRRRTRLRAGAAEPVVPGAPGLRRAHRRDLLLAGAPRVPAGSRAARAPARAHRCPARDERGRRRRGRRSLSRPVRARTPGGRPPAVCAGEEAEPRGDGVAPDRAAAPARARARARATARLGARGAPDPGTGLAPGRLAAAAWTDAGPNGAHRRRSRRAAPLRRDLRP